METNGAGATRPVGAPGIRPALFAAAAQVVVLTLGSIGYGFHRDELYFRMLSPAWGYVDQPPLTPWLARTLTSLVADEAWALRIPATVASAASVVLIGLIARELGGDRRAVAFAAWGAAFAGLPLALGHVLLTSTIDLPLTLAVVLTVLLALRADPRWWLAAGAVAGLATWNRLLVPVLLLGVLLGLAVLGPRGAVAHPVAVARGGRGGGRGGTEPRLPVAARLAPAGDGRGRSRSRTPQTCGPTCR